MREHPVERGRGWSDDRIRALVQEHERLVRAYLRSLGCPEDRVDDLAQETFLRLFARPAEGLERPALRAYLRTTARNLFLGSLRREAPGRPLATELAPVDRAWHEYERGDGGSTYLEALRGCLETLPVRTRDVLRMRYGSGTSRDAIAAQTRLTVGGVKSLILRGKERLRDCIERKLTGLSQGAEVTR